MNIGYQVIAAVVIDQLIGDPRWFPHPVRLIGRLAVKLEGMFRSTIRDPKAAGLVTALAVVLVTILGTYLIVGLSRGIHPMVGDLVSILIIYTGLAARDLVKHSTEVWAALNSGDMEEARRRVGMICGRDTHLLDQTEVVRATVESVAENMVDGVTAPLFFAVLGGPVGIMAYKAVSTLDSTFGYKNERYLEFGWASARLDDLAAYLPSRLTSILVPPAALILRQRAVNSIRIFLRDRAKHPSPNAGQSEAAIAGALGVQLGGLSYYGGKPSPKPELGDPLRPLAPNDILLTNRLMLATSWITLLVLIGFRVWVTC
ncbi:MAG: cobalamin biosynthesis protein CobD [Deltaproteobacteria bacterium]|nr:cobalamin biosynthesis protein CobD [Deltaproteobacteria bacterium]